jgi:hypothetical protein
MYEDINLQIIFNTFLAENDPLVDQAVLELLINPPEKPATPVEQAP